MANWLRSLADGEDAELVGGKARGLARLIAAGLRVPPGFVIERGAFRAMLEEQEHEPAIGEIGHALGTLAARIETGELPPALVAEVQARARELGVLAVRSSAAFEDGAAGSAAGVLESIVDVPARDVWRAIRSVWASALAPLAATYARAHGARGALAVAVIVQRFVPGARVVVYTRAPASSTSDAVWVQRGAAVVVTTRDDRDPIVAAAIAAERAIAADGGADVELIAASDGVWVVQARPIVRAVPGPSARRPPPPLVLAPLLADGRTWRWDITHNPDPLSPAQAYLVERVERAGFAPWTMRVCGGYLYSAERAPIAASEANVGAIEAGFAEDLGADVELPIEAAIERYLAFYRRWSTVFVPLLARAKQHAPGGARPSAVEHVLLAAARGELSEADAIARLGMLSPAWDVAAPTFGEDPTRITAAIARARATPKASQLGVSATGSADLAERDDAWFARAQWLVRRAILAQARTLGIDPADAPWLPLDELAAAVQLDPVDAKRRAAAARAMAVRAGAWEMPLQIPAPTLVRSVNDRGSLRGFGAGIGGVATGRVVRFGTLATAAAVTSRDVIVTRAVTPALAVLVVGCAALVSETGGPLDHGAALARELGIPCVVGCMDAWSVLGDGQIVRVDANVGVVTVVER